MTDYMYRYPLADFPGGKLTNVERLADEVRASPITVALDFIQVGAQNNPNNVDFYFKNALQDKAQLDTVVSSHDDTPFPADAQPVTITNVPQTQIMQERKTHGHYWLQGLVIGPVPAGSARYKDYVIPDLTNGMDWLNYHFDASDADSGDILATGKLLAGAIGALAAPAAQGDVQINVASAIGVLRPTGQGGAIDEGFYVSIGTDTVTDAQINAIQNPPGSGPLENPQPELTEYCIRRIGAPTAIGGGNEMVTLTLFTPLAGAVQAGQNVNLVIRGIPSAVQVTKGAVYDVGGRVLRAGNLPGNTRLRYGYKDSRSSGPDKTVRCTIDVMY